MVTWSQMPEPRFLACDKLGSQMAYYWTSDKLEYLYYELQVGKLTQDHYRTPEQLE